MSKPPTKNENKVIDFFTRKPYDIDHFNNHNSSGIALADFVNQSRPDGLVIDAGCGINPFKKKFKNLIGFDAAPYPDADFQATFTQAHHMFGREFADVVLALGSCNFGTVNENLYFFDYFHQWLVKGGLCIVRVHLNRAEIHMEPGTEYAAWTIAEADACAFQYFKDKFKVLDMHIETMISIKDGTTPVQLAVWVWKKL
jgi:hypothetical protein|tara:strand:+ start:196 stop:792 length:597 start_codon:yes stop_codon:yes gene_type:complete